MRPSSQSLIYSYSRFRKSMLRLTVGLDHDNASTSNVWAPSAIMDVDKIDRGRSASPSCLEDSRALPVALALSLKVPICLHLMKLTRILVTLPG
jgi:hypothetical protein